MTYEKPELVILGSATRIIQALKVPPNSIDGGKVETSAAYDPEE